MLLSSTAQTAETTRRWESEFLTSSSLSRASLSFLLLSRARSQTCCHLLTSRLTLGFLVSICVCDPDGYKLEAGKRFPVKTQFQVMMAEQLGC